MHFLLRFLPGIARVLSNATPVILLFILSKFASVEELGLISYYTALITIIGILIDFGLPEAIQKYLAKTDKKKYIFPTILLEFILGAGIGGIFVIFDLAGSGKISNNNTLLLFLIFVFSAIDVLIIIYNGLGKNISTSIYFITTSLIFIGTTFFTYFSKLTDAPTAFLIGRLVSWSIVSIISLLHLVKLKLIQFHLRLPRRYLLFALNSFILVFCYSVLNQWDSILITSKLGAYENGIYKSVSFLASIPFALSVILETKLLPVFSQQAEDRNFNATAKSFKSYRKMLIIGSILLTLLSIPFSYLGINIMFNTEIAQNGSQYFSIIFLSVLLYVSSVPAINLLRAFGKENLARNAAIVQTVFYVIFSTIFLPIYGLKILPIIFLLSNVFFFLYLNFSANKQIEQVTE